MAKGLRFTVSMEEARQLYPMVAARIAEVRATQQIRDLRPSEVAEEVAGLEMLQDRIQELIQRAEKSVPE